MWPSPGWLVSQTDAATPSTPPTARRGEGGATKSSGCAAGSPSLAGDPDHERGSTWDTSFLKADTKTRPHEHRCIPAGAITSIMVRARAERHPICDDAGAAPAATAARRRPLTSRAVKFACDRRVAERVPVRLSRQAESVLWRNLRCGPYTARAASGL